MQEAAKEAKVNTLIFTAHAHCFKLKRNLLTGKLPDMRVFFKNYFTVTEGFSFTCYRFTKLEAQFSPS